MEFKVLNQLIANKNQHFHCTPAGKSDENAFIAQITHQVTDALSNSDIKRLEQEIGVQEQLFNLLSIYGSVRLYCDTLSDDSAFYIAHPSEWQSLENDFNLWINDLDDQEKEELLPDWLDDAIVFGEIPSSGNYFLYLIKGEHQGKVFEFEHDGFEFIEIGKSIIDFLEYICSPTEKLIQNIHSHTRYSDGKTDIQWLAQAYAYEN